MFGVVLWSDTEDQKAVIWCEDHGDLAFYSTGNTVSIPDITFDAGDLVQFDLTTERQLRLAHNPRLVSEGVCPDIAETLVTKKAEPVARPTTAEILPFEPLASKGRSLQPQNSAVKTAV